MGVRKVRIERQRFCDARAHLVDVAPAGRGPPELLGEVRGGQPGVRGRKIRIECQRALVIANPPIDSRGIALRHAELAAQEQLVRLGMYAPLLRPTKDLVGDARLDVPHDRARDLALQAQHVDERLLVALRPEVSIRAGVHEVDADAHAIADAEHRPFDDRVNAELFADLRQRSSACSR